MAGSSRSDGNEITYALKMFLFSLPPAIVAVEYRSGNRWVFGASFIVGTFVQALLPPHRLGLKWMLLISAGFLLAYVLLPKYI